MPGWPAWTGRTPGRCWARLHAAQNTFYSGGGEGELRHLLAPDIAWHVPGVNAIAGTYQGHEEVIGTADDKRKGEYPLPSTFNV